MSNVSLEKAIELMTSRHTSQLKDRHAAMVRRICSTKSQYAEGFYYKDLDKVIEIIKLLNKGIEEGSKELVEPLCRLINHCKIQFRKEQMSDETLYVPKLPEFLNVLYPILKPEREPIKELLLCVCSFITDFAKKDIATTAEKNAAESSLSKSKRSKSLDNWETNVLAVIKTNGTKYLKAIAATELPEGLVHILADNVTENEIAAQTVSAMLALSMYAPLASKIGELGVLKDLVVVICNHPNFRDPLVNLCIECIWNILEQSGDECIETLAREELIISLRWCLQRVIKEGYKLTDRKLRNELMILISAVVACPETHAFFLSREESPECFLEELIKFSSYDELNLAVAGTTSTISANKAMWGVEPEDLELKKLLWTCTSRIISSKLDAAIEVVVNSDFLPALLLYLDPSQKNQAISRWQQPQLKEIQMHALNTIFHILPIFPEHFQQQNGNYCLVHFLSSYSDNERKLATLKALEVASQFQEFKTELAEEGLFDTLLDIVQSEADYPLFARELALSIISNACKNCRENQKEIRRKGWIELIKANIKPMPPIVTGEPDQFLLAVLDCLWHAILQNKRSTLHFIDIEGITALLDYLDECLEVHRRIAISCLCHLLKISRAKAAFSSWNSKKNMANASQLLIRIYEEEEKRLGVAYDVDGVLKDPRRPLAYSQSNNTKGFETLKETLEAADQQSEVSILRKKQLEFARKRDLRASIFCCLSLADVNSVDLLPKEKQKLEVIRMYPDFRKGELFLDIKNELETLGIRPTQDDGIWLNQCLDEAYEQATNTIKNQSMIAKQHKNEEEQSLVEFYKTIMRSGAVGAKS
ncbi:unnamed protein product [Blepharisma stoltei]|uniref:Cilia- and flagella-associated protein 69 ARM repeats domain-containing protein n=1 Tax=Blepharisma stoltei TaxID=1481888 RepID=A0AAU9JGB3_9CILI|nr:unnamed protein product [Blepharisma stoltei]